MPHDPQFENATPRTIYTLGYGGGWDHALVLRAIEAVDGILVDIRFKPSSRDPRWRQPALRRVFGERYLWLQAFGNENYKGGPVRLLDPDDGVARVAALLGHGTPPILMCACRGWAGCHRRNAAELASSQLGVPVVHLEAMRFQPPAADSLFADQAKLGKGGGDG
jgi:uncharacterized protein (DUF488 family)